MIVAVHGAEIQRFFPKLQTQHLVCYRPNTGHSLLGLHLCNRPASYFLNYSIYFEAIAYVNLTATHISPSGYVQS